MILQHLTLRNFGLYGGEHLFDLSPGRKRNRTAPIILFGGVNGGGKTSILDAIQLVLYGNRARCSKRGARGYDEFLTASVNHNAADGDGAAIQLAFHFAAEGQEHLYEVTRTWSRATTSRGSAREKVEVSKDGVVDGWLSENWHQVVEELIPFGIAQLCFFDAEKIRFLAEDETSSEALGVAIKSLLGLDLAERLVADAGSLEARLAKRTRATPELAESARLEEALELKRSEIEGVVQQIGSLENSRQLAMRRLRTAEEQFAKAGGKLWKQREAQQHRRGELDFQLRECEERLRQLSATELPLALVPGLLNGVSKRALTENTISENQIFARLLTARDEAVLALLKREKLAVAAIRKVETFLEQDRAERAAGTDVANRLLLSDGGRQMLTHLLSRGLPERRDMAAGLLKNLDTGRRELEQVQRSLSATPDEESIRGVAEELKNAAGEESGLAQQVERLNRQLMALRYEYAETETVLKRLRRKLIDEGIRSDEEGRVGKLLQRTQETMKTFLRLATDRKIDRLSELVTNSFRYLLRKKTLVQQVRIDPGSLAITLVDAEGRAVSKERLSEGEKQIFAISVLWGLSQASSRPLPAIIDTPMARLDVAHRDQLVERYFPRASHQVILLSTDTEIERHYFEQLQPHIARAYHLNYDEGTRQTSASQGYFWDVKTSEDSA